MKTMDPNTIPEPNDYLWDGTGTVDPEVQRLESLLSEFRQDERPLRILEIIPSNSSSASSFAGSLRKGWTVVRLATAALVFLALGATAYFALRHSRVTEPQIAWDCVSLEGNPQIGSRTIVAGDASLKLKVGQTITTNSTSRASVFQNDLGEIQIEPNTRMRLVQSVAGRKRIKLELGTIHAAIWAPPTEFVVDTPSATAVDLGCAYTLQVDPDGSGTLRTTLGWVGFHLNGRDAFIPAGAMCYTRPGIGPGTPCFEDASPQLREALHAFDDSEPSSEVRAKQLAIVLAQARARDALTLWHLLSRTSGVEREQVYERLVAFVPPPQGVTRQGILALNHEMLDRYWDELGLGRISVWRMWQQSRAPAS